MNDARGGNGLTLGNLAGARRSLLLSASRRDKHLYIAGATGTGKSKLLEHLIRQDVIANRASGCGLILIDPHGSLYDNLLAWMTYTNINRPLILIDMREAEWVVGYNVLRQRKDANPAVIVDNFVQAMAHVWGEAGTDRTPLFARWAGNTLRALYEREYTLADAMHLLGNRVDVRSAMTRSIIEPMAHRDWEMANGLRPDDFEDRIGSTVNRLRRFLTNENVRCMFGQPTASLDLGEVLDQGAIVLVSLAREKGRVSEEDARLFATLLLTDLWTAAQERGKRAGVKPFYVYIDEFQKFVTPTIAENLDQARGFGLHLTLATQFPKQILNAGPHGVRVHASVMENASSKIVFALNDPENLESLAKQLFLGTMNPDEVKHKLHSTKVMGYKEEWRTSYSRGRMDASAHASHSSTSEGETAGGSEAFDRDFERLGETETWSGASSKTSGETESIQSARSSNESDSQVLLPQMGQELSSVQFRSLEEQLHRAMVALFDQRQRCFTVRLAGMRAPVSVETPWVEETLVLPWRIKAYADEQMKKLPFAFPAVEALRRLRERDEAFADQLTRGGDSAREPTLSRRRVKK